MTTKQVAGALVLLLAGAAAARAQGPVDYLVRVADPGTPFYHVEAELPATGQATLVSLPAWTPGHYMIENYARYVQNFAARAPDGRALGWDKLDKDTWRIHSRGQARVRVSFDFLADTMSLSGSLLRSDFGFFNGTNLFVYPETGLDFAARVRFELPAGWRVATELEESGQAGVYTAADYHELVDNPTFVGHFAIDSVMADGRWIRLAVYPGEYLQGVAARMALDALQKIADYAHDLFGRPPYDRYTTLLYLYPGEQSYGGGLEHANSHFDILPQFPLENAEQVVPGIYGLFSHEYYHAWNVKRIRPAEMWPYRYDEEQYTPLLWVSEGFASYYGPLILARTGLSDEARFWDEMQQNIESVESVPPTAVEDVSLSTWIRPTQVSGGYYYSKGAVIGLLLDVKIRSATGNRHSLDDVMARLYHERYERGRGFTSEDFLAFVAEYIGRDGAQAFYRDHIDGRVPLPYREVLALAGLSFRVDTIVEPMLGVGLNYSEGRVLVESVVPGSAAEGAGLAAGDQLLRVGVVEVRGEDWGDIFRRTYADSIGSPIAVEYQRGGERRSGSGALGTRTRVEYRIDPIAGASEAEVAIRRALVGQ
jgi:predicted metalloprotease with PDZ domain